MDKVLAAFINDLPPWSVNIGAVIFLLFFSTVLWYFAIGAKRFTDAINKENQLVSLLMENNKLKDENKGITEYFSQYHTALENLEMYIKSINDLRTLNNNKLIQANSSNLIQKLIESLVADIKNKSGERHRCGLWIINRDNQGQHLTLYFASSGFPDHYVNTRNLDLDRTLAGKAFRLMQFIKSDDVRNDPDWEPNPDSTSQYNAIIAIPINSWGVLTVDAINPMNDVEILISHVYARLIEGVLQEHLKSFVLEASDEEVASSS